MADVYVKTTNTTGFTLPSGTTTKITGLSLEEAVGTGWHVGNQRYECQSGDGGLFVVIASCQLSASFAGNVLIQARVNNADIYNLANLPSPSSGPGGVFPGLHDGIRLSAGDYLDLRARQDSGSNKNITVASFTIRRVGD